MKPLLGAAALLVCLPLAACGGSESSSDSDRSDSDPTSEVTAPAAPEGGDCIKDHKWTLDTDDTVRQLKALMEAAMGQAGGAAEVKSVEIKSGTQTLDMTGDKAIWTDSMVVDIVMSMGANGQSMEMEMIQSHDGTASGDYKIDGATLVPEGTWDGTINIKTTTKMGGQTVTSPMNVDPGSTDFSKTTLGFTCADDSLVVTVPGKSPLSLKFS